MTVTELSRARHHDSANMQSALHEVVSNALTQDQRDHQHQHQHAQEPDHPHGADHPHLVDDSEARRPDDRHHTPNRGSIIDLSRSPPRDRPAATPAASPRDDGRGRDSSSSPSQSPSPQTSPHLPPHLDLDAPPTHSQREKDHSERHRPSGDRDPSDQPQVLQRPKLQWDSTRRKDFDKSFMSLIKYVDTSMRFDTEHTEVLVVKHLKGINVKMDVVTTLHHDSDYAVCNVVLSSDVHDRSLPIGKVYYRPETHDTHAAIDHFIFFDPGMISQSDPLERVQNYIANKEKGIRMPENWVWPQCIDDLLMKAFSEYQEQINQEQAQKSDTYREWHRGDPDFQGPTDDVEPVYESKMQEALALMEGIEANAAAILRLAPTKKTDFGADEFETSEAITTGCANAITHLVMVQNRHLKHRMSAWLHCDNEIAKLKGELDNVKTQLNEEKEKQKVATKKRSMKPLPAVGQSKKRKQSHAKPVSPMCLYRR